MKLYRAPEAMGPSFCPPMTKAIGLPPTEVPGNSPPEVPGDAPAEHPPARPQEFPPDPVPEGEPSTPRELPDSPSEPESGMARHFAAPPVTGIYATMPALGGGFIDRRPRGGS